MTLGITSKKDGNPARADTGGPELFRGPFTQHRAGKLCILPPKIPQLLYLPNHQIPMRQFENTTTTYRQALPVSRAV